MSENCSRRDFMKRAALASSGLALGGCASAPLLRGESETPRNVLLLMTDQMNASVLSCVGHPLVKTPNLDRLASEGVLFENACCAYPVCTASRGALHTGRWPHVQGPHLNVGIPAEDPNEGLPADETILASLFWSHGFTTTHHGKWHLGDITRHPCYNWREGLKNYYPSYRAYITEWKNAHKGDWPVKMIEPCLERYKKRASLSKRRNIQNLIHIGQDTLPLEVDKTVWLTEHLLSDLDSLSARPFMITWSVDPPHAPWKVQEPYYSAIRLEDVQLPKNVSRPEYYDRFTAARVFDMLGNEECIREYLRCYFGLVMKVDDQIGRILNRLEQLDILDDTLIVFTSDHGDMQGAHRHVGKSTAAIYDGTMRVPLIMRWPRGIPSGRRVRTHVNGVDVMPTILDYANLPVPEQCQGESLRPYIDGDENLDKPAFCEQTNPNGQSVTRTIRTHEWKLTVCFENWSRKDRTFVPRWPHEIYHIAKDPGEETNLHGDPSCQEVEKQLLKQLADWMRTTKDAWAGKLPIVEA